MLAIVLSRTDFKEFDQMISLYTRERGKTEALAKGIKKITSKNSPHLAVLSLAEVDIVSGREIDRLAKALPVKIFEKIYFNFDKIFIAGWAAKIADANILANEPDERIFNLLLSFLEFLNTSEKNNFLNLAIGFNFKFWHCLGFGTQRAQDRVWLENDWETVNDFELSKSEQLKTYEFIKNFAIFNGGKAAFDYLKAEKMLARQTGCC